MIAHRSFFSGWPAVLQVRLSVLFFFGGLAELVIPCCLRLRHCDGVRWMNLEKNFNDLPSQARPETPFCHNINGDRLFCAEKQALGRNFQAQPAIFQARPAIFWAQPAMLFMAQATTTK